MGTAWGAGAVLGLLVKPEAIDADATSGILMPSYLPYTEQDDGSTSVIHTGDLITIRLYENPAAGFVWKISPSGGLRVIGESFVSADPSGRVTDAGGWRHITLRPETPGAESLNAVYKRSWEPETGS